MSTMSRLTKTSVSVATAAIFLSSCANVSMNETQKTSAIGAGIGAVAGALIGGEKGALLGAAVGGAGGYGWSRYMESKKAAMEKATAGTGVQVTQTADNQLKVNIPSDISFDKGHADIKPALHSILDQFANGLSGQPKTEVRIVGYTDSTGSDAINMPLSVNRASSTRDYLVSRSVAASRITIDGRGDKDPIGDNSTEAGRAKNRRVEIFLAEKP
jgi:outer membrane protein OmpA-like peptidoglycan-associated protein